MKTPPIVSQQDWEAAREQLLVKEKEVTRARDALAAERRRMPWLAVTKEYEFDGPMGKSNLLDLFEGRRQLILYRAFFEPGVSGWPDHACVGCSLLADQVADVAHLHARDTTLAFASRAPQPDIERVKSRMGWQMPWYTITDDFDTDFGVNEWHGTNAFIRDGDSVFRTYFINNRGDEAMGSTWSYLDLTALGRQEDWEDSPESYPQSPPYAGGSGTTNTTPPSSPDSGNDLAATTGPQRPRPLSNGEDVAQFAREGLGLTGVSELAAEEAAVVAREQGRRLTEQFGGGHGRASGERAQGLLAHSDHDAGRRRGQPVDVRAIVADRPGPVGEQRIVTRAVVLARHPEQNRIRRGLGEVVVGELALPRRHCDEGSHARIRPTCLVRVPNAVAGALGRRGVG